MRKRYKKIKNKNVTKTNKCFSFYCFFFFFFVTCIPVDSISTKRLKHGSNGLRKHLTVHRKKEKRTIITTITI